MPLTPDQYSNFGGSTIHGGAGGAGSNLEIIDTSLTVQTGDGATFPAATPFMATIGADTVHPEIVQVNTIVSDTLSGLTRGQEGTSARQWAPGSKIQPTVTAGSFQHLWSAASDLDNTLNNSTGNEGASLPSGSGPFTFPNWLNYLLTQIKAITGGAHWYTAPVATILAIWTKITNANVGTFNVRDYGATGNGSTDDRAAIQSAADACRSAGGGTLYFPSGTYLMGTTTHPVNSNPVCCYIGNKTRVRGDGPGNTILKLANSSANSTWILTNYQVTASYTDTEISVSDLTVDGNSANQNTAATVDLQFGIKFHGVNGLALSNVVVKNVCGTNSGGTAAHGSPSGEGMHFDLNACSHVAYSQCRAYSDKVMHTSTGFSANRCNDVSYVNCWAHGLLHGQGFTHWTCWSMRYANCWASDVVADGFHSEFTDGIFYVNCQSGGTTNANLTNPYTASTNLGSSVGFHVFNGTNYHIVNCIGQRNTNYGVMIEAATGPGEIIGGSWNNNNYGIRLQDAASTTNTTIKGRPDCSNNTTSQIWYWNVPSGAGAVVNLNNFPTAPTVPSSTTALTNPFPFDVNIYIVGGTVTVIAVDGTTVGTGTSATVPLTVILRQGGTITLTYSVTPTWKWQALT